MISANPKCSQNTTSANVCVLLGFHISIGLQIFLFILFLTIYLLTIVGNILIVITVSAQDTLHSPMYLLLCSLSLAEILYTTNIAPTMLRGFLAGSCTLSFAACLTQLFVFGWLADTECILLTVMAYDRYLAICFPLQYMSLMDTHRCCKMVISVFMAGLISPSIAVILLSELQFPGQHEIDHFFCDFEPILRGACSEAYMLKRAVFSCSLLVTSLPLLLITVSYFYIIMAILRIPTNRGRHKAFSTCSSHLAVVVMYFGTLITIYVAPTSNSFNLNKVLSLLYTVATPLLNPCIYTLRNKDIREACRKTLCMTLKLTKL